MGGQRRLVEANDGLGHIQITTEGLQELQAMGYRAVAVPGLSLVCSLPRHVEYRDNVYFPIAQSPGSSPAVKCYSEVLQPVKPHEI